MNVIVYFLFFLRVTNFICLFLTHFILIYLVVCFGSYLAILRAYSWFCARETLLTVLRVQYTDNTEDGNQVSALLIPLSFGPL